MWYSVATAVGALVVDHDDLVRQISESIPDLLNALTHTVSVIPSRYDDRTPDTHVTDPGTKTDSDRSLIKNSGRQRAGSARRTRTTTE
jgi:hypothetical protein